MGKLVLFKLSDELIASPPPNGTKLFVTQFVIVCRKLEHLSLANYPTIISNLCDEGSSLHWRCYTKAKVFIVKIRYLTRVIFERQMLSLTAADRKLSHKKFCNFGVDLKWLQTERDEVLKFQVWFQLVRSNFLKNWRKKKPKCFPFLWTKQTTRAAEALS
jgi:hypothetical protein